jgi:hypothetical protein
MRTNRVAVVLSGLLGYRPQLGRYTASLLVIGTVAYNVWQRMQAPY